MKTGTLSEYAAHAAVSPAYVTKLKKQGRIVLVKQDGRELVNFDATDRLVANTADLARARNGANAKPDREPTAPAPEEPPAGAAALTGGEGAQQASTPSSARRRRRSGCSRRRRPNWSSSG